MKSDRHCWAYVSLDLDWEWWFVGAHTLLPPSNNDNKQHVSKPFWGRPSKWHPDAIVIGRYIYMDGWRNQCKAAVGGRYTVRQLYRDALCLESYPPGVWIEVLFSDD